MTAPSSELFVPLALAAVPNGKREDFRVLVAQRPEEARSLREVNSAAKTSATETARPAVCDPRVTVHRDGDCITGVQIHCSCGQIIDLTCAYQTAPAEI